MGSIIMNLLHRQQSIIQKAIIITYNTKINKWATTMIRQLLNSALIIIKNMSSQAHQDKMVLNIMTKTL